jgi:hypothetical protein
VRRSFRSFASNCVCSPPLPGVLDGQPVQPTTQLLRESLDAGQRYVVNEEVPRTGTRLRVAFNRTLWSDGRAVVWLTAQPGASCGEGSSGLRFDTHVETLPLRHGECGIGSCSLRDQFRIEPG